MPKSAGGQKPKKSGIQHSSKGKASMRKSSLKRSSSNSSSKPSATASDSRLSGVSSATSVGFLARPKSISSLASVCKVSNLGKFTSSNAVEDLTHEKLGVLNKYGHSLHDTIMIYLTCPYHKKVALTHFPDRGLFLPHGSIRSGQSWLNACLSLIGKIMPDLTAQTRAFFLKDPILIDQLRVQVPIYLDFVTRVVYHAQLTQDGCKKKYCEDTSLLQWNTIESMVDDTKLSLIGPETEQFYNTTFQCREISFFTVLGALLEKQPSSLSTLVNSLNYKDADLIKIYSDFLQHTFPSEYMSKQSFKDYFNKLDYQFHESVEWIKLFQSFTSERQNYLNFHDFLTGLTKLDRCWNEKSNKSLSSSSSSKTTVQTSKSTRKPKASKSKSRLARKLRSKSIIETDKDIDKYNKLVGKWVLSSPLKCYKTKQAYPSLDYKRVIADSQKEMNKFRFEKLARDSCTRCGHREYTIAQHVLTLQQNESLGFPIIIPSDEIKSSIQNHKSTRKQSAQAFLRNFVCNQVLDVIRAYAYAQKVYSVPPVDVELKWDNMNDRPKLVEKIKQILTNAKATYSENGRVLINVCSPCYVIGDIHGNLHDLLLYEQTLWKLGVHVAPTNYLFLGDIVDRGNYSIECALYLICLKLIAPTKIHILRGNHESRSIQKEYTFEKECLTKFGDEYGVALFEMFNEVFDYWPLAGVLDDSIFCAHGGIPSGATKLEQINSVQLPLKDPESDGLANEILWNDPLSADEFKALLDEYTTMEKNGNRPQDMSSICAISDSKQFIFNKKRGTANYFSDEALMYFLTVNGFSHIIRAHELIQSGYQFMFGGRCITIFSCAKYCEGVNEAAVALVTGNKIRIIKIDKNLK